MLKHLRCDFCQRLFKRGHKIDFLIHKVFVRGGEVLWSYDDDIEFYANFCSKECMRAFLDEWYYFKGVSNGNAGISEAVNSSGDKQEVVDETSGDVGGMADMVSTD